MPCHRAVYGVLAAWLGLVGIASFCQGQPKFIAVNLTALNTPDDEDDPHLSAKGLRLYYASKSRDRFQLLVAVRKTIAAPWPAGRLLNGPDDATDNRSPCLSADEHDLYFATRTIVLDGAKKTKEPLAYDLVHSTNVGIPTDFTAPTPLQLLCTEAEELFPWITADGKEMYFNRKTKEGWRLFVSSRPGKGAFGEPKVVEGIPAGYRHPSLSNDRRTMYLEGPLGDARSGLFRFTRANESAPWGEPMPLEEVNNPDGRTGDGSPCLSRDGTRLYFSSDRPGGKGGRDLWVINDPARLKTKK